jgi:hypothetical protein
MDIYESTYLILFKAIDDYANNKKDHNECWQEKRHGSGVVLAHFAENTLCFLAPKSMSIPLAKQKPFLEKRGKGC